MLGCKKKEPTLRRTMQGVVEDVLWEGGVLTIDEIYRGVEGRHAQLGQLLPPRWQEEVKQILEAHCISHGGNSWFLENIEQSIKQILEAECISHDRMLRFLEKLEPLEEWLECEMNLFDPHGTSERIINDSNRGQKRTDWANTESYRYLDLALPEHVAGDMVRKVALGTFQSGLHRRLANWVYPRGHGPVWRLWQPRQAGPDEAERQGHAVG
jgi:hypothetical protein